MAKHSFICNVCIYCNRETNEELDVEKCNKCNGLGYEWKPINKELYEKDHKEYMKHLILGSR